jgi:benzoyl-CoA 2,3-dioxygenase component B
MRNLFQVNVEEGRHLWAMVYLLQKYFGRDGREEAEELLQRRSGNEDKPRILGAFNEKTPDWLSFFMFTHFTDRDGKMQLESLAQSGFDPLSRTCRFMLMEEAFHMFVGETGISRTIEKTCQRMNEAGVKDPYDIDAARGLGVIDLPTIQRKINFHISVSRDLFGAEVSTNAANSFNAGIKGRFQETRIEDDHQLENDTYTVLRYNNNQFADEEVPALSAINARLLDDYIKDCQGGVNRWNKVLEKAGMAFNFQQPHKAFNRSIGEFSNIDVAVDGEVMDEQTWQSRKHEWLPTDADLKFLVELMQPVTAPGEYASWIASPKVGIDKQPGDFEYVRI